MVSSHEDQRFGFHVVLDAVDLLILRIEVRLAPLFELLEVHGWVPDFHQDVEVLQRLGALLGV